MDGRLIPGRPAPSTAARALTDPSQMLPHGKAIAFDLETTGVHRLWTDAVGTHVRISAWAIGGSDVRLDPNPTQAKLMEHLSVAGVLAGHNILAYDLPVLHRHHGAPTPFQLLAKGVVLHDTQLTEALLEPPQARWSSGEAARHYSLDNVAERHGFGGKAFDLKKMAKHYAKLEQDRHNSDYQGDGFDLIPLDNPDFLHYLRQDVVLARLLASRQLKSMNDYVVREHRIAAIAAQMTINGFRVDVPELRRRVKAGDDKRAQLLERLHDQYNLPRTKADGKAAKNPAATKNGKLAIVTAFDDAGLPVDEFKATPGGSPALGQDYMAEVMDRYQHNQAVVELAELVLELNGVRSIYGQIENSLAQDRVHPTITMRQASGRWSLTNPGLTVVGKRSGRVTEREVFLAEPGEVILAVDLSQVDARAVAAWSQDENYLELFGEGRDIWSEMAELFGISRDAVKVVAHGANYGMGVAGTLRHNPSLTRAQVEAFHNGRREQFPKLIQWQDRVREQGQNGELLENGFGRKLKVDPDRAYTQAPALVGQSAARDIMMQGLLNLDPALHTYLRCLVHDEIVLSVPAHSAEDIAREVQSALTFEWAPPGASIPVQIKAEASIGGKTWASAYAKD